MILINRAFSSGIVEECLHVVEEAQIKLAGCLPFSVASSGIYVAFNNGAHILAHIEMQYVAFKPFRLAPHPPCIARLGHGQHTSIGIARDVVNGTESYED